MKEEPRSPRPPEPPPVEVDRSLGGVTVVVPAAAKRKLCPLSFGLVGPRVANPQSDFTCQADRCMAWVEVDDETGAGVCGMVPAVASALEAEGALEVDAASFPGGALPELPPAPAPPPER